MSIYSICFSPTGGTKKVIQQIAKGWREIPQEIDLSDSELDFSTYSFTKEDICLIAVPSFGGRVPAIALEHLLKMKGSSAKAILIVSYGNRAFDDTLLELQDATNQCGFHVVGAVAAVTEHSIMRQYGTQRPDAKDCEELADFARTLVQITATASTEKSLELPGNRPFRSYNGVPMKPKASKHCTQCGQCQRRCPVGAIPEENPSKTNDELCISCMRCIAVCPVKARSNSKMILLIAGEKMKNACIDRKLNELFVID